MFPSMRVVRKHAFQINNHHPKDQYYTEGEEISIEEQVIINLRTYIIAQTKYEFWEAINVGCVLVKYDWKCRQIPMFINMNAEILRPPTFPSFA